MNARSQRRRFPHSGRWRRVARCAAIPDSGFHKTVAQGARRCVVADLAVRTLKDSGTIVYNEPMTRQRILVIEDDLDIANVLRLDLSDAGFDIDHADTAMTGLIKAREEHPDLILLDLGLPDFDGGDVVQRLRKNSTVPVIVLTARDTIEERVRLLGLGADDYVIKPFHPDELLARIKVQLRQRGSESLTLGDLELDPQKRLVRYKSEELRLSPKEFDILALLIRQPGRVYSRQEIGQDIWQGRLPDGSNVVDVHMANLRAKLRDLDGYGLLRTVRGVGYALRG